jgi:hypothetical protein
MHSDRERQYEPIESEPAFPDYLYPAMRIFRSVLKGVGPPLALFISAINAGSYVLLDKEIKGGMDKKGAEGYQILQPAYPENDAVVKAAGYLNLIFEPGKRIAIFKNFDLDGYLESLSDLFDFSEDSEGV